MVSGVLYLWVCVGVEGVIECDNYNRIKLLFISGKIFFFLFYKLILLYLVEKFGVCNDCGLWVLCIKYVFCVNYMLDGLIFVFDLLCKGIISVVLKWLMNIRIVLYILVKYVYVLFKLKDEILLFS